jgi:hypothetical protein
MQEIIVPEDGLIYKTINGRPIMQIHYNDNSSTFSIFSKDENSKILLTSGDKGNGIFIFNGEKEIRLIVNPDFNEIKISNENSDIALICNKDASGVIIGNGQKDIELTVNPDQNEIRFTNENGKITHWIHSDEEGGQIDLADNAGNLLLTMGINSGMDGSVLFLNNKSGDPVVALMSGHDIGYIEVNDENKETVWSAPKE